MDLMDYRRKIIASSPHLSHAEGAVASFADGVDLPLKSMVVNIDPVQSGTGDPSSSNIRPISGWGAVKVTRTGKNLFQLPTLEEINNADMVGSYRSIPIQLAPNTRYYLSTTFLNGYTANGKGMYGLITADPSGNNNWIAFAHSGRADGKLDGTVTTNSDGLLYIRFNGATEQRLSGLYANSQIQLEVGLSATPYEPYTGQSITIQWSRKNLWHPVSNYPVSANGITFSLNDDGSIHVQGTATGQANNFPIASNGFSVVDGTYTTSVRATDPNIHFIFGGGNNTAGVEYADMVDGSVKTFTTSGGTTGHNIIRVSDGVTVNGDIYIQLEKGAVATPYSQYYGNYLHINQWDEEWETGTINNSDGQPVANSNYFRTKNFIRVMPNASYYFKSDDYLYVYGYDQNQTYIGNIFASIRNITKVIPATCHYIKFVDVSRNTYNHDISVNYPSDDKNYHPHDEFIVYGSTLNPLTGELVVDRYWWELKAVIAEWTKSSSYPGGFYTQAGNYRWNGQQAKTFTPFICSHAKTAKTIGEYQNGTCYMDNSINIRIMPNDATLQDWVDYLTAQKTAGTPVQICCYLMNPVTYYIDPQTVRSLVGYNNIFADTGNTSLEYWAHP